MKRSSVAAIYPPLHPTPFLTPVSLFPRKRGRARHEEWKTCGAPFESSATRHFYCVHLWEKIWKIVRALGGHCDRVDSGKVGEGRFWPAACGMVEVCGAGVLGPAGIGAAGSSIGLVASIWVTDAG